MKKKAFFRQQIDVKKLPDVIRYKWRDATLVEGIIAVPKMLLRNLSSVFTGPNAAEEIQVALTLVDYRRRNEPRYPTIAFLAFLAGMSPEVFETRVVDLEQLGLVKANRVRDTLDYDLSGLMERTIHFAFKNS